MHYLGRDISFSKPSGAEALTPAGGVSWRVFSNPVTLAIGGITAVLLELAEPRVRHGVWDHSDFRKNPLARMKRTARAAMITVYAPAKDAEEIISGVTGMHRQVRGTTPEGARYAALDPELLNWVHATASFGFLEAYHRYALEVSGHERDLFYREGRRPAALYGAHRTPRSVAEQQELFTGMRSSLEPSDILNEFMEIVVGALPGPRILTKAIRAGAVGLLPADIVDQLQLAGHLPTARQQRWLRRLAGLVGSVPLPGSPYSMACKRMSVERGKNINGLLDLE